MISARTHYPDVRRNFLKTILRSKIKYGIFPFLVTIVFYYAPEKYSGNWRSRIHWFSHLVDRLLAEGRWHVTVVDDLNDFYSPEIKLDRTLKSAKQHSNFEFAELDIRDAKSSGNYSTGREFDCIVHLAGKGRVSARHFVIQNFTLRRISTER